MEVDDGAATGGAAVEGALKEEVEKVRLEYEEEMLRLTDDNRRMFDDNARLVGDNKKMFADCQRFVREIQQLKADLSNQDGGAPGQVLTQDSDALLPPFHPPSLGSLYNPRAPVPSLPLSLSMPHACAHAQTHELARALARTHNRFARSGSTGGQQDCSAEELEPALKARARAKGQHGRRNGRPAPTRTASNTDCEKR